MLLASLCFSFLSFILYFLFLFITSILFLLNDFYSYLFLKSDPFIFIGALSNVTFYSPILLFRPLSSSSCTKLYPFQIYVIYLYPAPTILFVPFTNLLIISPLLLKTFIFWHSLLWLPQLLPNGVHCNLNDHVDEALDTPDF